MKIKQRIAIVEDQIAYRETIAFAIKADADVESVFEFGTAEIALRRLAGMLEKDRPTIILLDLRLPGMSGLEAIPKFRKVLPQTEIIIVTQSESTLDIVSAIKAGASGYLLKSATIEEIKSSITSVSEGGASLDPNVAKYILNNFRGTNDTCGHDKNLSEREREILQMISAGLLKKEIADKLDISVTTVAYHVKHIYEKLNVQNAAAAVSKAYRKGILH